MFRAILSLLLILPGSVQAQTRSTPKICDEQDEFVKQFRALETRVLGQMGTWMGNHYLVLGAKEVHQFNFYQPKIKVCVKDRVYLDPKDKNTEVTFVNEHPPTYQIPTITIGRIRWNENFIYQQGFSQDILVLHELLRASGLNDGYFEISNPTKKNIISAILGFYDEAQKKVLTLLEKVKKAREDRSSGLIQGIFDSAETDPNYKICMAHPGDDERSLKYRRIYCRPFFSKMSQGFSTLIVGAVKEARQAARNLYPDYEALKTWGIQETKAKDPLFGGGYVSHLAWQFQYEFDQSLESVEDHIHTLDQKCPTDPNDARKIECYRNYLKEHVDFRKAKVIEFDKKLDSLFSEWKKDVGEIQKYWSDQL